MLHLARKRFWKEATVESRPEGHAVLLDGRAVKTPAKNPLVLPAAALAREIAAEWQAQGDQVDPATMPQTRRANAAIDGVAARMDEVVDMLADYAASDLLCHRAEAPRELAARQADRWNPYLDRAADELGARLVPATGVMPRPQDPAARDRLRAVLAAFDPFRLTALHDLVTLTGSVILGLAAARGWEAPETVWQDSRLDEEWQIAQWGEDAEARAAAERKRAEFLSARRFLDLLDAG